jgi:hypothetical protein
LVPLSLSRVTLSLSLSLSSHQSCDELDGGWCAGRCLVGWVTRASVSRVTPPPSHSSLNNCAKDWTATDWTEAGAGWCRRCLVSLSPLPSPSAPTNRATDWTEASVLASDWSGGSPARLCLVSPSLPPTSPPTTVRRTGLRLVLVGAVAVSGHSLPLPLPLFPSIERRTGRRLVCWQLLGRVDHSRVRVQCHSPPLPLLPQQLCDGLDCDRLD